MNPLELLYESEESAPSPLPAALERLYGGGLGLRPPLLYANFVTSLDGVAVVGTSSGSQLSGKSEADRFVMGLLRSFAEVILIGSGTLRESPGHVWTPEHVFPAAAAEFAQLRRRLGLESRPLLAVVSGSGELEFDHPGLRAGALVLTSEKGRAQVESHSGLTALALGSGADLDPGALVAALRERGHRSILTEGGPRLLGQLVAAGQLDELFLTLSPQLAGEAKGRGRRGLVSGVDLLGEGEGSWLQLISCRRHQSHLFLRYRRVRTAA